MYLNFPSNPTAATGAERLLRRSRRSWAERSEAWVLHDFAYGDLVFDGRRPQSFLAVDGARDIGVELFSYVEELRDGRAGVSGSPWETRSSSTASSCYRITPSLGIFRTDPGGGNRRADRTAGLGGGASREPTRAAATASLAALHGNRAQSQGTFFIWFRLPDGVTADHLLAEHRVAVAPGEGFGARGAGWARLSLAVSDELLDHGLERLRAGLHS